MDEVRPANTMAYMVGDEEILLHDFKRDGAKVEVTLQIQMTHPAGTPIHILFNGKKQLAGTLERRKQPGDTVTLNINLKLPPGAPNA